LINVLWKIDQLATLLSYALFYEISLDAASFQCGSAEVVVTESSVSAIGVILVRSRNDTDIEDRFASVACHGVKRADKRLVWTFEADSCFCRGEI
jgi:hypothetical protein